MWTTELLVMLAMIGINALLAACEIALASITHSRLQVLERLREISGLDLRPDLPAAGARTVSEWIEGHLQAPVVVEEVIRRGNLRVVIRKVRRQKVLEAYVDAPSSSQKETVPN